MRLDAWKSYVSDKLSMSESKIERGSSGLRRGDNSPEIRGGTTAQIKEIGSFRRNGRWIGVWFEMAVGLRVGRSPARAPRSGAPVAQRRRGGCRGGNAPAPTFFWI